MPVMISSKCNLLKETIFLKLSLGIFFHLVIRILQSAYAIFHLMVSDDECKVFNRFSAALAVKVSSASFELFQPLTIGSFASFPLFATELICAQQRFWKINLAVSCLSIRLLNHFLLDQLQSNSEFLLSSLLVLEFGVFCVFSEFRYGLIFT